jgi:hypothetical protein
LNYVPEYRARRVYEHLKPLTEATVDDMRAIHADRISIPGRVFAGIITDLEPRSEAFFEAVRIFEGWDGSMERDAVAPTIYSAFRIKLLRKIVGRLADPLAEEMFTSTGRGAPRHLNELASRLVTMARKSDTSLLAAGTDWKKAESRFPVILERTPYNKAAPRQVQKAKYFARRGYVCAIQEVRGRFESEGEWYPFAGVAEDGYDTVQWLGAQPWSSGFIFMHSEWRSPARKPVRTNRSATP